jgi:PAS domain-containing protein
MHKDGSIRWILVRGQRIRNEEGQAVRMVGTDSDITERKQAEQTIKDSEEKFRSVFEQSSFRFNFALGTVFETVHPLFFTQVKQILSQLPLPPDGSDSGIG